MCHRHKNILAIIAHKCLESRISMSLIKTLVTLLVVCGAAYSSRLHGDPQTLNCTNVLPNKVCSNPIPQSLAQHEKGKSHKKRNAFNLYYMIEECTKCRAWDLLGYGSYCGLGGSGTPVDNIDRCCQNHDNCYGEVINKNDCWRFNVYVLPYDWKVYSGSPYCGGETNKCRREICYCDKQLTECLNSVGCP